MKVLIVLFGALLITSFPNTEKEVYLCGPRGAKKYHFSKTCRGLSNCKHEITPKKQSEAEALGLTLCGWED
ncbi:MAG: hypothetical protein CMP76_14235 [Flavobacterium sp.]|uniref:hypothetical protein n=1 Tax=Flavobacterium sp. TaxID=239 RepID=UPI000C59EC91|nr:hypothetical protein [Flavobacterium sp.]MBF04441.1 hypothetical protein [Flavobacterium sp.]|tara:strand:+ start:4776 stop:4988 length:213 start_codon:yes stop_codon:yes gene_type:complete